VSQQAAPGRASGIDSQGAGWSGVTPERGGARVFTCFDCGQFHRLESLAPGAEARCRRCHAVLRRRKRTTLEHPLAWAVAALATFLVAAFLPFLRIDLYGRTNDIVMASGPRQLDNDGMWVVGLMVGVFTLAAPAARLLGMIYVLTGLRARRAPPALHLVLRMVEALRVWSMLEVYLLGVFVAYTKLIDLAHVEVQTAGYALGAGMLLVAAMDSSLDHEAAWQALEARGAVHDAAGVAGTLRHLRGTASPDGLIGCTHCGFVVHAPSGSLCPRCGGAVHARKPNAMERCWALLIAATILYIPANVFPILTAIKLGNGEPSTIIGGVRQLAEAGMFPLAALVFFASLAVPIIKLLSLALVLISTRMGARGWLRDRTNLFRVIEAIGRWSMIDMFMLSILVALVRLGFVASVTPGDGAIAFACVVVLTMLASMAFDPRLMWDAALSPPAAEPVRQARPSGRAPHPNLHPERHA
jgi:paraquat-inducible protein A